MTVTGDYTIERISPKDEKLIDLIGGWYNEFWQVPLETTKERLTGFPETGLPFHLIVKQGNIPVATGGLYTDNGVGLLRTFPEYKKYPHWISVVYTIPEKRRQGIGIMICRMIEEIARQEYGLTKLYLFTNTAEKLYLRNGWKPLERVWYREKDTVIMEKEI